MTKDNIYIKNRKDLPLYIEVEYPIGNQNGIIVIEHGLAANNTHPHIKRFAEVFLNKGYIAVTFDATNALGKSGSDDEGFRYSGHYHDLVDVIGWVKTQSFYKAPLTLAGHSFGATSICQYAEEYHADVGLLIPLAPVISGILNEQVIKKEMTEEALSDWEKIGFFNKKTVYGEGVLKVPFAYLAEANISCDIGKNAGKITARTILINGDNDRSCPLKIAKEYFFDRLTCEKELVVLKGATHNVFKDPEIFAAFTKAIEKV